MQDILATLQQLADSKCDECEQQLQEQLVWLDRAAEDTIRRLPR